MLASDEWQELAGYPMYEVSSNGAVRSKHFKASKLLRVLTDKGGYLYTQLWVDGRNKQMYIHRAVATTFIPNPHKFREVRHLDDNKLHNHVSNLAWGTPKDNTEDKRRNGKICWGDTSGVAVITVAQGVEIVRRYKAGETPAALSKEFGLPSGYIWALGVGKRRPYLQQMASEAA